MSFIQGQQQPILILDSDRCKRNINRMIERANNAKCDFRPHFKTHQSKTIGRWIRDAGVNGITVSSISMANYFIEDGWDDVTIAFPFFHQQVKGLKEIENQASLRLFINSPDDLELLNNELKNPFKFFIEIDPGSGRSGISYNDRDQISQLIETSEKLDKSTFHGFYTHDGRTYGARSTQEIQEHINPTIDILVDLKSQFPNANISMGDTPSASTSDRLNELDEMTPGNFFFMIICKFRSDLALWMMLPCLPFYLWDKKSLNQTEPFFMEELYTFQKSF